MVWQEGLLSTEEVDLALGRALTMKFNLGMLNSPKVNPYSQIGHTVLNSAAGRALAIEAAQQSIVLLTNLRAYSVAIRQASDACERYSAQIKCLETTGRSPIEPHRPVGAPQSPQARAAERCGDRGGREANDRTVLTLPSAE